MKKDQKYNKRKNNMEAYIDALIENNSKICTIRIDLGYGTPYANKVTLNDMNKDINNLLNNRRSKKTLFENNIGYIIKKEHGENGKGVHGHAYLFYDGNKVQKEVYIAKQIGEYWKNNITKGKGVYYNCNVKEYKNRGIGMLDYKDEEKIKILKENAISYLLKTDDQSIDDIKTNSKDRAIVRGTMPKPKSKAGRPRIKG